jgi:photosystem II stability/assembly factor-like uncharacterized protein
MSVSLRNSALVLGAVLLPVGLPAQEPAQQAAEAKLKGVWEPVSFAGDVYLNDVVFATPDIGWVTAGAHGRPGLILHTTDGGANWQVQQGDPESETPSFHDLRFIDAQHGWVLQDASPSKYNLLQTVDGKNWSPVGSLERRWGMRDYTFISEREGMFIDGNDNVSRIMRTEDGGRTWNEVFACRTTLQIQGLTKNVACALKTIHFPTPTVGYAVGGAHGAKRAIFVAKTEDSGKSWSLSTVGDVGADLEVYFRQEIFFSDERTGVAHLSDHRLYRTEDGGKTWVGVVGTPGPDIRFADPVVGWSFSSSRTLNYTVDGGKRWLSRQISFPAKVTGFSLPRRDRAYVVGDHGMVYRYRVLGPGESPAAKALSAPAMPAFDSPLDDQVGELAQAVQALEQAVAAAPEATSAAASPGQPVAPAAGDAAAAGFAAACCAKSLNRFDVLLTAVGGTLPQFLGAYKNTNLLLAGIQMITDLPARVKGLDEAVRVFKKAADKAAAQQALVGVVTAAQALSQTTAVAFQKQAPVPGPGAGQSAAVGAPAPMPAAAAQPGDTASRQSTSPDTSGFKGYAPRPAGAAIQAVSLSSSYDDKFSPDRAGTEFPDSTRQVAVWYRWDRAPAGKQVGIRWSKGATPVLEQADTLVKPSGESVYVLKLSAGSRLPRGEYQVELFEDGTSVSRIPFRIGNTGD